MSKKEFQINVAVTEEMMASLQTIHKSVGIKPTEVGRQGFAEMIGRLQVGPVSATERRALASLRKLGVDPVKTLKAAAKIHLAKEATATTASR